MHQHMSPFIRVLPVCVTALWIPTVSLAQGARGEYDDNQTMPTGYVGERIQELLFSVNANDPEVARAFVLNACSPEFQRIATMAEHQAVFAEVYNESRGLTFHSVRTYTGEVPPNETVIIVRNKLTEGWNAFVLTIQPQPPHLISGIQFAQARPPRGSAPLAVLSDQDMAVELERFASDLAAADAFSGTVLFARHGRVLYQGAFGRASKRFNVPNRVDTKFNLGSMNKMFTGVAIVQLVQRGTVSLDDPLSKYVSTDWLPRTITDTIKIKHLLTHTSGLGSYFNKTYMESSKALFRELDDYKPLISGSTLAFDPGTGWQYSNTGMFMLGVVIENATKENYFNYIRDNIAKPAGMINTDCYEMDKPVPNLAIGYSRSGTTWTNNLYKHVLRGGPAGGGFSTVEDLLRFDRALRGNVLLDAEHTAMVWSPKPELNAPNYGYGFGAAGTGDDRIVGHGGGFDGISSNLDMFLDSGYTAIVMSNYDGGSGPLREKMRELVGRRQVR